MEASVPKKILIRFCSAVLSFCLNVLLVTATSAIASNEDSALHEINQSVIEPQKSPPSSATHIYKVSDCFPLRKVKKCATPQYPSLGRSVHVQGSVVVEVEIDVDGKVVSAIAISGPPLLRASAVAAARQWEFEQDIVSGKPVATRDILTFRFSLDDREPADTLRCQTN
jgi:protein TonB